MENLICKKCGSSIGVGSIFCPVCGVKPDSEAMEENARVEPKERSSFRVRWGVVVSVLIAFLVIVVGLLFWPNAKNIGLRGDITGSRHFVSQMKTLNAAESPAVTFSEGDVNAYLKFIRVPQVDMSFCNVTLRTDEIHIRAGRRLGPFKFFKGEFSPKLTVDIWCLPTEQGVTISKVLIGHLPIAIRFTPSIVGKLGFLILGDYEKLVWLDNVKAVEVKKEEIVITLTKSGLIEGM